MQPNASLVSSAMMEMDFLAYEPEHPMLRAVVNYTAQRVLSEAELWRAMSPDRCMNSHRCVIAVTGPNAYRTAIRNFSQESGCENDGDALPERAGICDASSLDEMRRIYVCDAGLQQANEKNWLDRWYCGVAKHWDCRNSEQRRDCGTDHYSSLPTPENESPFFEVSAGGSRS